MKAIVRMKMTGMEYVDADVVLKDGFAFISNATLRELMVDNQSVDVGRWSWIFNPKPAERLVWKVVKTGANIIVPASQVLWVQPELRKKQRRSK
jgi:hypothetical protein